MSLVQTVLILLYFRILAIQYLLAIVKAFRDTSQYINYKGKGTKIVIIAFKLINSQLLIVLFKQLEATRPNSYQYPSSLLDSIDNDDLEPLDNIYEVFGAQKNSYRKVNQATIDLFYYSNLDFKLYKDKPYLLNALASAI